MVTTLIGPKTVCGISFALMRTDAYWTVKGRGVLANVRLGRPLRICIGRLVLLVLWPWQRSAL